ncbi:TetR/AcrR family transcriptional regulator [Kitasatospora sp. NPDC018619]|uniref:TetR/AcrR family transcriptional regulator n=1 Tax=unclassified Kitasatospora TaxID=2633591 RepID=UPI0037B16616
MSNTTPPPSRARRADARSSAARIVAAGRIVLRSGEGSLEQIAAEAGVGIATLYRHFPNREALVRAVLDDILETDLLPLVTDAGNLHDPRRSLQSIATRMLDLITEERGLATFAGNFNDAALDVLRRFSESLGPVLEEGQRRGEIRTDITTEDIPHFLVMSIAGLVLPGITASTRARFTALLFDALSPAGATPLPSPGEDADDLRPAISGVTRT